jgi:membrane protein required for beta-lactamase induction
MTFVACIAAASTALVAQDHVIPEPYNHWVAALAIIATAVAGVLTKLPRNEQSRDRAIDRRSYEGTGQP